MGVHLIHPRPSAASTVLGTREHSKGGAGGVEQILVPQTTPPPAATATHSWTPLGLDLLLTKLERKEALETRHRGSKKCIYMRIQNIGYNPLQERAFCLLWLRALELGLSPIKIPVFSLRSHAPLENPFCSLYSVVCKSKFSKE